MKKIGALLLTLAILLLSLPLMTGCGAFLTADFSAMDTEIDLDAYLATLGLSYQDCYDYPDYLETYKNDALMQKLLSVTKVNWGAYEKIGEINAAVDAAVEEAEYYYNYYGGASGTGFASADAFAPAIFGYDAAKYRTVREWKETTLKEAVLKEELTRAYLTQKGMLPTEEDVDAAYETLIGELLAAYPGMTRESIIAQFAKNYGDSFLRDTARERAVADRFTRHVEEDFTVKHAEAAPVTIDKSQIDPSLFTETDEVTDLVKITLSGGVSGDVYVRLYPDQAPITVANFQKLVSEDFYNGLKFHRSIKDFCLQGGDPKGDGTGGSDIQIKGEFLENGWGNHLHHLTGVVSMARSNAPDSASSQFFFTLSDSATHLDGKYAAFGFVVSGWDVIEAAAEIPTNSGDVPSVNILIETITFVTPVTE